MWLYFILLAASISIPLLLSFDKKLQFYKKWKMILPAITLIAIFYIVFDVYLTKLGVWGFNSKYILNIYLINLPVEEVLFFLIIPYASIFIHYSFILYFPKIQLSNKLTRIITIVLILLSIGLIFFNIYKIYTVYAFSLLAIVLIISLFDKSKILNKFFITFLIILIPFIIVNSILTGTYIDAEVVWYNNNQNLNIRFLTIPLEDFAYGFSLILFNLFLISGLNKFFTIKIKK